MTFQAGNLKLREKIQCSVKCCLSAFGQWNTILVIVAVLVEALEWTIYQRILCALCAFSVITDVLYTKPATATRL